MPVSFRGCWDGVRLVIRVLEQPANTKAAAARIAMRIIVMINACSLPGGILVGKCVPASNSSLEMR